VLITLKVDSHFDGKSSITHNVKNLSHWVIEFQHSELWISPPQTKTRGVCVALVALLPFTWKRILRQKKEWKGTQIFHHAKMESSKNPLKGTKILHDIITL
jgi:hypothetical protein